MKNKIFALLAAILLSSCCVSQKVAERKIKRFVKCNPGLLKSGDTINVVLRDTILTDPVLVDTTITLTLHDTVFFESPDGIKTKIVRLPGGDDSNIPLSVSVECPPDTVFVELSKQIPLPDKIVVDETKRNWNWWVAPFLFGVLFGICLVIILLYYFNKK